MARIGATPEEWDYFSLILGLTEDMLPVVSNPLLPVAEKSSLKQIGKVPSLLNRSGEIIGIRNWTQKKSTPQEISDWSVQPDYGFCIIARHIRAIDIDIMDYVISRQMMKFVFSHLGTLPVRVRPDSGKCLIAFTMEGDLGKRSVKTAKGIVEILGNNQQFVAAGTHTSGKRYEWAGGLPNDFPIITQEQFEKFWNVFTEKFGIAPPSESGLRNAKTEGDASKLLTDPVALFLADKNFVRSWGREGQVFIDCPWKDQHTRDSGESETAYFCAGTRGYDQGSFKCLHAHCADKTTQDFLIASGYAAEDFDVLPDELEKPKDRFNLVRADHFANRPSVEWIIKGLLPRGKLGMTFGGSGDGKTFIVLDMVLAICQGIDWNGHKVKQGHCVYICAEGAGGFTSRLKAYALHKKVSLKDIGDYLTIIPDTPNFRSDKDVRAIAAKINAYNVKTDLIITDTLAQVTTGADENSAKDMSIAIHNAELLSELTQSTGHLIHHAGKDENRGARGWSGMKGPLDAQFQVSRKDDEIREFWVSKMKDGKDGFGYCFKLETIIVGEDADGDPIESCFVSYQGKADSNKNKNRKLGKWQQIVSESWEYLGGAEVLFETVLTEAVSRSPKPDGKDIRREKCRTALQEIITRAGYRLLNDKITTDLG